MSLPSYYQVVFYLNLHEMKAVGVVTTGMVINKLAPKHGASLGIIYSAVYIINGM